MKVDRIRTALRRTIDDDDDFVVASPNERVALVWELTREVWSLKSRDDVERRLQRHITHLVRKGS